MEDSLLYFYVQSLEKRIEALEEKVNQQVFPMNHEDELLDSTTYNRNENVDQAESGGP